MFFSKQNLFYIFLIFIFSCSPKQIDQPAPQPKVIRPIWLDGLPEDSLFIYGISKLEKNSQLNLDSIASNQIISVIKENFIQEICDQNIAQFNFDYSTYLNFNEDVNLTIDDLPQGLTFNISPDKLNNSTSSGEVKIFGLENLSPQDIHISLKAESASISRSFDFDLNYRTDDLNSPELLTPEDNLEEVSLSTTLTSVSYTHLTLPTNREV